MHTQIFLNLACATPQLELGRPLQNAERILELVQSAHEAGHEVLCLPPLSLSGLTLGHYATHKEFQQTLRQAFCKLIAQSEAFPTVFNVGAIFDTPLGLLPIECLIRAGDVIACVVHPLPKGALARSLAPLFAHAMRQLKKISSFTLRLSEAFSLNILDQSFAPAVVPLFHEKDQHACDQVISLCTGLEDINQEDGRAPIVLCPLLSSAWASGGDDFLTRISLLSEDPLCTILLSTPGAYESMSDHCFRHEHFIASAGESLLAYEHVLGEEIKALDAISICPQLLQARAKQNFRDRAETSINTETLLLCECVAEDEALDSPIYLHEKSEQALCPHPLFPCGKVNIGLYAESVIENQIAGIARRLELTGSVPVLGLSGGMDSTVALLACALVHLRLKRPLSDIHAITLPGFGTGDQTYQNVYELMHAFGLPEREISIREAVTQHLKDIEQPEGLFDITYENAQARERTQILMDYANRVGGLVIGTGDLSEIALGWCTYNGDHMSMLGVNGAIAKTLMPHLLMAYQRLLEDEAQVNHVALKKALRGVLDAPISPELLPRHEDQSQNQQSEKTLGSYALHDFFIGLLLQGVMDVELMQALAHHTFTGENLKRYIEDNDELVIKGSGNCFVRHEATEIDETLSRFLKRFKQNQFKRSCTPDGVAATVYAFAPRTGLLLPSDLGAFDSWSL